MEFDASSEYEVGEPTVPHVFRDARVDVPWRLQPLFRKDSLEMTDADRAGIRHACETTEESRILITHGPDTLCATADGLAGLARKTIVLAGALAPTRFRVTDAVFNLGLALGAVQSMELAWFQIGRQLSMATFARHPAPKTTQNPSKVNMGDTMRSIGLLKLPYPQPPGSFAHMNFIMKIAAFSPTKRPRTMIGPLIRVPAFRSRLMKKAADPQMIPWAAIKKIKNVKTDSMAYIRG